MSHKLVRHGESVIYVMVHICVHPRLDSALFIATLYIFIGSIPYNPS